MSLIQQIQEELNKPMTATEVIRRQKASSKSNELILFIRRWFLMAAVEKLWERQEGTTH